MVRTIACCNWTLTSQRRQQQVALCCPHHHPHRRRRPPGSLPHCLGLPQRAGGRCACGRWDAWSRCMGAWVDACVHGVVRCMHAWVHGCRMLQQLGTCMDPCVEACMHEPYPCGAWDLLHACSTPLITNLWLLGDTHMPG